MQIGGLILAAGLSSRMGAFKPMLRWGEKRIIENSIDSMLLGTVCNVTVVLGYKAEIVEQLIWEQYEKRLVQAVINQNYASTEMLDSVKIGLEQLPACDAFFLLPGDMPAVSPLTFQKLISTMDTSKKRVVFPAYEGRRKHPPLISADCIPDILSFHSAGGLRELWKQYKGSVLEVPVDDVGCSIDLDTPQDYHALITKFVAS